MQVTAYLAASAKHIDLSVKVTSNHAIGIADTDVCISAVGMPKISLKKYSTQSYHDQDFLSLPVSQGQTILNPIKRLTIPRFQEDSFQYNESAYKTYLGGYPDNQVTRGSWICPGNYSIPMLIFGNFQDKEGFLYYALDPDGLHAKNFQFFADSYALHIRSYDLSDHAIDPWGMGGKDRSATISDGGPVLDESGLEVTLPGLVGGSSVYGSTANEVGWSVRIRPFTSPTKWVDQYGAKLYKSEVVPTLEDLGVVRKSFYERYLDGELDLRDVEIPNTLVAFGFVSGDVSPGLSGTSYFQNLYKNSTSPVKDEIPKNICFYYLAQGPLPDSLTSRSVKYWDWTPWGETPGGPPYDWSGFTSPDITGINSRYRSVIDRNLSSGQLTMGYQVHPFYISATSAWVSGLSGIDMIAKTLQNQTLTYTNQIYAQEAGLGAGEHRCCPSISLGAEKFRDICAVMGSGGLVPYFDTYGLGVPGTDACFALEHKFYVNGQERIVKHPRAVASHYFNHALDYWLELGVAANESSHNNLWNAQSNPAPTASFSNIAASEYPMEVGLKRLGASILYPARQAVVEYTLTPTPTSDRWTGSPRSDAIQILPYTLEYNIVRARKPNWNISNPIFSTVYGDRCILLDWIGTFLSNAMTGMDFTNMWRYSSTGGWDPYLGTSLLTEATPSERIPQFKNWLLGHLDMYTRTTSTYQSPRYGVINSYWSGCTETVEETLDNPTWTGLRDYAKKVYRLLAYAPDHMYNGHIEHNLETWATPANYSAAGPGYYRQASHRNINNTSGDDSVMYGVRRHRSDESVLIWLANWTTQSAGFTGNFDPAAYEFNRGYTVQSIGLNDSDNGTITDLGIYSKTESYKIAKVFSPDEFKAYVFSPISSLTSETFVGLTTDFFYIRYEYTQQELRKASLTLSYEYDSPTIRNFIPKSEGFRAPATQAIVNNLPQWMALRQDTSSNGWMLVNSWGQNFETVLNNIKNSIPDKYLAAATINTRSLLNFFDITNEESISNKQFNNLLFNSSFTINDVCRRNMPAGWTSFNRGATNVSTISNRSFISPKTIKISDSGKFGQTIYMDNLSVDSITSSVYLAADTHNVDISMLTQVELIDGTVIHKQSKITTRSTEWRRLVHTVDVNKQVYRIQFIVFSNCSEPAYFNSPKVEIGNFVSKWTRSEIDFLPYYPARTPFSSVFVVGNSSTNDTRIDDSKIYIYPISNEEDFLEADIPTTIELVVLGNPDELAPFTNNVYGRKVSFLNEIYDTQWVVENNKVKIKSFTETEFDTFRELTIKDLSYDEEIRYGIHEESDLEVKPLLCCIHGRKLFVLCLETYKGTSKYVIKIVEAREPLESRDYLESIIDFEIDLPINSQQFFEEVQEELTVLAFSSVDPNYMTITTNLGRQFYYKLSYDYYYYQDNAKRLYTIESYDKNSKIQTL